jgi:hypothetical protein
MWAKGERQYGKEERKLLEENRSLRYSTCTGLGRIGGERKQGPSFRCK